MVRKKTTKFKGSILGIIFGVSIGFGYEEFYGIGTWHSAEMETKDANVCFTPPKGCADLIAKEIQSARKSLYLQAYGFSSLPIINQVKFAQRRGVRVRILLDSSNFSAKKSLISDLRSEGIEVVQDKVPGIAHNKIIIIDEAKVITGSFNFTKAADTRNAENVILIKDPKLSSIYLENWKSRYNKSKL